MKELGFEPTIWSLLQKAVHPSGNRPQAVSASGIQSQKIRHFFKSEFKARIERHREGPANGFHDVVSTGNSSYEMSGCLHGRSETPEPLTRERSEVGKDRGLRRSILTVSRGNGEG